VYLYGENILFLRPGFGELTSEGKAMTEHTDAPMIPGVVFIYTVIQVRKQILPHQGFFSLQVFLLEALILRSSPKQASGYGEPIMVVTAMTMLHVLLLMTVVLFIFQESL
jgi:hypothetical protein